MGRGGPSRCGGCGVRAARRGAEQRGECRWRHARWASGSRLGETRKRGACRNGQPKAAGCLACHQAAPPPCPISACRMMPLERATATSGLSSRLTYTTAGRGGRAAGTTTVQNQHDRAAGTPHGSCVQQRAGQQPLAHITTIGNRHTRAGDARARCPPRPPPTVVVEAVVEHGQRGQQRGCHSSHELRVAGAGAAAAGRLVPGAARGGVQGAPVHAVGHAADLSCVLHTDGAAEGWRVEETGWGVDGRARQPAGQLGEGRRRWGGRWSTAGACQLA